jgi:hypothetical protein
MYSNDRRCKRAAPATTGRGHSSDRRALTEQPPPLDQPTRTNEVAASSKDPPDTAAPAPRGSNTVKSSKHSNFHRPRRAFRVVEIPPAPPTVTWIRLEMHHRRVNVALAV